ncbi:hypothetical protein [Crocosphaera sp. XPORK-15E]|uniref:hypothetical protein n=1 Tax=Crocosphaera sp. XPORK-15E TaxID=3110247 RepID=UPI002B215EFC|nr:hypothetical protein [Crocosphaera sp. XPORK-15E]MEA5536674.1 hypothetical protein [Crocosphaera sp. XPORK-15E]
MPQPVRVPDEIYQSLQEIKFILDPEYRKASPSIQDLVTVALTRMIEDWEHPISREELLKELLEQRDKARSKMGKPTS